MKTSSNNIPLIEKYLQGSLTVKDRFLFEARLLLEPKFREEFFYQKKTWLIVKMYYRKKQKEALEIIHNDLFQSLEKTTFQQSIFQLFQK